MVQCFEVPLLLVNLAAKFLPQQALKELEEKGLDLNMMKEVAKSDGGYVSHMEIIEKGVKTTVSISLI